MGGNDCLKAQIYLSCNDCKNVLKGVPVKTIDLTAEH